MPDLSRSHCPWPWTSPGSSPAPPAPRAPRSSGVSGGSPRAGLSQPRGTTSAGPGGDTAAPTPPGSPSSPRDLQGPSSASFHPTSAPLRSSSDAKATGRSRNARRCCALDLHSSAPCPGANVPQPGRVLGVGSALLYPRPSKRMLGWIWGGRQQNAGLGNFSYHEMAILCVMRCVL